MALQLTADYADRVYAGVLGKIIGVYLGRPFEGWSYETLLKTFGEVSYYVNQHRHYGDKKPALIVSDDDISGTFTFFRALEDHGFTPDLTSEQIGRCWLNYIVENKAILWWGGLAQSTEHTAFLRLQAGIPAPRSGSIELNGATVAEQIGAQIFIDAWGLCCPGDPAQAARFARAAGSVSHDGEAVNGAVVIAAMEALAFVEKEFDRMLDGAVAQISAESLIARQIADIRAWVKADGNWHKTFARIKEKYGYDKFPGNCHIIPNHGLVIMALLYAPDDFSEALKIVNTCGWDTDCNSANVGCIMGVRVGLAGMQRRHDWRGPVADCMFLPTAEGGRSMTDALSEAQHIVRAAHALAGVAYKAPKDGARWNFQAPGSVQGWRPLNDSLNVPTARLSNDGDQLQITLLRGAMDEPGGAVVQTFLTPEMLRIGGYGILAAPQIVSGQTIKARVSATAGSGVRVRLAIGYYGPNDVPQNASMDWQVLKGSPMDLTWRLPDTDGRPIYNLRLECKSDTDDATVLVYSVAIRGTPTASLIPTKFAEAGDIWRRSFIDGITRQHVSPDHGWRITQDKGVGVLATGCEHWSRYRVTARAQALLANSFGLIAGYGGLLRQVRFTLDHDGRARLTRVELDGEIELASAPFVTKLWRDYDLALEWDGATVRGLVDGKLIVEAQGLAKMPSGGGVGLLLDTASVVVSKMAISAL